MELSSPKFKFLVIVLCTFLQLPGGLEAKPLFDENRGQCGKMVVNDSIVPGEVLRREMPWVVVVKADVGRDSYTCSGTIVTPRVVLTSKFCAPGEAENTRYVIQWRFKRSKPVVRAHIIEGSPFTMLEVASPPFRSDFAACLPFELNLRHLNNEVTTAAWQDPHSDRPEFDLGFVHKEVWTLEDKCGVRACDPPTDRCICAIARRAQSAGSLCAEDEGKPVVRWVDSKWFLVGIVTNLQLTKGRCLRTGGHNRFFQKITDADADKIKKRVQLSMAYYLPDVKPETDSELRRRRCGRGASLELGGEKQIAPFLIPGVVAIHGRSSKGVRNCTGVFVGELEVLTAKDCVPRGFDMFTITHYTITHNSLDLSTGFNINVKFIGDPRPFGNSYVILQLEKPVIQEMVPCLSRDPFQHTNQSVVVPSWAFNDIGGKLRRNHLYYEKWVLRGKGEACGTDVKAVQERQHNPNIMCAETATDTYHACKADLGQPVMQYRDGNWYLVGMVTHVVNGIEDCELRQERRRFFEWISFKKPLTG